MRWWWLSFSDSSKPKGSQWLGCAIVEAPDLGAAVRVAHLTGCNPGGEVMGQHLHPSSSGETAPPETMRNRLITDRGELERWSVAWSGAATITSGEADELERS